MFLCLDTSHGATIALLDGPRVLGRAANDNPRQHTEALTPMIREVMQSSALAMTDLEAIVVGTGPAPFTGLRVGLITARTLAHSLGIPCYGVPALAGIARGVFDDEPIDRVTVLTDARRKEVYAATYAPAGEDDVEEITAPVVVRPADIAESVRGQVLRGAGVMLYPEHFAGGPATLDPASLGRIARTRVAAARAAGQAPDLPTEPLYLRRPDIHHGAGPKRAS